MLLLLLLFLLRWFSRHQIGSIVGRPGDVCQAKVYEGFGTSTGATGLFYLILVTEETLLRSTRLSCETVPSCNAYSRPAPPAPSAQGKKPKDPLAPEALGGKGTLKRTRQV